MAPPYWCVTIQRQLLRIWSFCDLLCVPFCNIEVIHFLLFARACTLHVRCACSLTKLPKMSWVGNVWRWDGWIFWIWWGIHIVDTHTTHVWANVLGRFDRAESIRCDLILLWMTADGLGSVSLDLQGALAQLPWRKKTEVFPRFFFERQASS